MTGSAEPHGQALLPRTAVLMGASSSVQGPPHFTGSQLPSGNAHCQGRLLTKCWLSLCMSCSNPPVNTGPAQLPVTSMFHGPEPWVQPWAGQSGLPGNPMHRHSRASFLLHARPTSSTGSFCSCLGPVGSTFNCYPGTWATSCFVQ